MKRWLMTLLMVVGVAPLAYSQFGAGMAGPDIKYETAGAASAARAGEVFRGALRFTLSEGWHVNAHEPLDEYLIPTVLRFESTDHFAVRRVAYPQHKMYTFAFSSEPLAVYEEVFLLGFEVEVGAEAPPGEHRLTGTLRYQACNDNLCAPPRDLELTYVLVVAPSDETPVEEAPDWFGDVFWRGLRDVDGAAVASVEDAGAHAAVESGDWQALADRFVVTGTLAGFTNTRGFLDFLETTHQTGMRIEFEATTRWWWLLWIVLGGGLLLNLTPCVLPLIPVNIAIIGAGARAGSRARGFALGGAYGLGIALVYGALGLVVVLGLSTAFGAINSTAWFNGAIAALFVALALAMFDVIQIDFSRFQTKFGVRGGGGGGHVFAALGMGAVSALLAGACVAPVVIYTILQAQDLYSQGNVFALALPFGLGVGMALPWPFLGAGLSLLPRPGMWMVRVKQAFGVFILLFALYYGHLAYTLARPGAYQPDEDGPWMASLESGLALALEEGRPVIIDFWATWCKNCAVMDRNTLQDETVLQALEEHVKIKYQAETLMESPVKEVIEYFKVMGLPTFVVLEPKG